MCVGREGRMRGERRGRGLGERCWRRGSAAGTAVGPPAAPGSEGRAGGRPATGLPAGGELPWDRGGGGSSERGVPIAKRNEEPEGCVFKLVCSLPAFARGCEDPFFGERGAGRRLEKVAYSACGCMRWKWK